MKKENEKEVVVVEEEKGKENELPDVKDEPKEGWWKKLHKGAKAAIIAGGTLVAGGVIYLVSTLFGKDDDEEPIAIETKEETEEE